VASSRCATLILWRWEHSEKDLARITLYGIDRCVIFGIVHVGEGALVLVLTMCLYGVDS